MKVSSVCLNQRRNLYTLKSFLLNSAYKYCKIEERVCFSYSSPQFGDNNYKNINYEKKN